MRPLQGHLSPRTISALMDGELDFLVVREARLHISRCRACRLDLQEMEEIDRRVLEAGAAGRPRGGLLAGLPPVLREAKGPRRSTPGRVAALVALALGIVTTVILSWPGVAEYPPEREVVLKPPRMGPPVPPQTVPDRVPAPAPLERVEQIRGPAEKVEAAPEPAIPSLEFVVTRIRPPAPPPPRPGPAEAGGEIALNPPTPEVVHQEAEAPPPPGGPGEVRGPVEVGSEGPLEEGVPRWILASVPREVRVEEAPRLHLRISGARPRDLASRWPSSSEERHDNVISVAIELAAWH